MFHQSRARNQWIEVRTSTGIHIDVYVRKSTRLVYGIRHRNVFDIASITVQHSKRGQGAFKEFLSTVEEFVNEINYSAILVENILEPRLHEHLIQRAGFRGYANGSAIKVCEQIKERKTDENL